MERIGKENDGGEARSAYLAKKNRPQLFIGCCRPPPALRGLPPQKKNRQPQLQLLIGCRWLSLPAFGTRTSYVLINLYNKAIMN